MKKLLLLVLITSCFLPAWAFRLEYGGNIIISQPVYEDLYIAGGNVTINAPVYGDLIVAGGTIVINDTVTNDILLAGGSVTFNGYVGDDIRCAGGKIRIARNVTGDVVVAGGQVTIDKGVTIGGLLTTGGDITVDGDVAGNVHGAFGELELNGNIGRDIDCRGGTLTVNGTIAGNSVISARYIIIGREAHFSKGVRYWSDQDRPDFAPHMAAGTAIYDPSLRIRSAKWYYLGATTLFALLWYIGMALLMIIIIQYLFSVTMQKAADTIFLHSFKSFGFGLMFFLVVPVAAIVALVTVIGVPVGLLLLLCYIVLILLATVITSVVMANWINNRYTRQWSFWRIVFSSLGIFVGLKLMSLIPFAGWLIMIVMACIAFGAILLNVKWKMRKTWVAMAD